MAEELQPSILNSKTPSDSAYLILGPNPAAPQYRNVLYVNHTI